MPPLTCLKGKLVWLGKARGHRHTPRGRSAEDADAEDRDSAQSQERDHSAGISPLFPPKKTRTKFATTTKKQKQKNYKTTRTKLCSQTLQSQTFSTKLHSIIHHNLPWVLWIRLPATDPSLLWTCTDWIGSLPIFKTHPIPPLLIFGKVNSFITDR